MSSNTQKIATVPLEAQTSVELLEGITPDEVRKLKAERISGLNDLWMAMGADKLELSEIEKLASRTRISSDRLIELLPGPLTDLLCAELLRRADDLSLDVRRPSKFISPVRLPRKTIWQQASLLAKKSGLWIRHHLLDWILLSGVLVVALLSLRAAGLVIKYNSSPFGLNPSVVITRRDLKAGDALQIDRDLFYAQFPMQETYFGSTSGLEGLVLKRDVSAQKPLRSEYVLRLQVVATRDIAAGEKIPADAVKLDWSTYDPKAILRIEDVINHQSRYATRKDSVILQRAILTPI